MLTGTYWQVTVNWVTNEDVLITTLLPWWWVQSRTTLGFDIGRKQRLIWLHCSCKQSVPINSIIFGWVHSNSTALDSAHWPHGRWMHCPSVRTNWLELACLSPSSSCLQSSPNTCYCTSIITHLPPLNINTYPTTCTSCSVANKMSLIAYQIILITLLTPPSTHRLPRETSVPSKPLTNARPSSPTAANSSMPGDLSSSWAVPWLPVKTVMVWHWVAWHPSWNR